MTNERPRPPRTRGSRARRARVICAVLLGLAGARTSFAGSTVVTPATAAGASAPGDAPVTVRADSDTLLPVNPATRPNFDHSAWNSMLRMYVDDAGRVAYKDWIEDRTQLRRYLDALGAATPAQWPREEQIAFWINAYNAGLVSAVMQGQSPETLIGRARLFKSWKFRVAGRERTPDEIEHDILRKQFQEARIHFALVCASTGCPPLRRAAYAADSLVLQLDDQARRFVNDRLRNHIDADAKVLELSSIFDWFRADFERSAGSVPRFLAKYVYDAKVREWLLGPVIPPPRFRDYDWSLNQQPFQRPDRKKRVPR